MELIKKMVLEKNTDPFFKAEFVKLVIRSILGTEKEIDTKTMVYHLNRIRNQKYNQYELTETEQKIKEGLEKNGIKIITASNYLENTLLPEHYKLKIREGRISPKQAKKLNENSINREKACLSLEILEEGRKLVWRLSENV